jgi:hypothetical protein
MKEREVRTCIEQFLRATARNVVVPASMGLGLAGCGSHALQSGAADAGRDSAAQIADVAVPGPDAAPEVGPRAPEARDAAAESDLPLMAIPYIVALPPSDAPADQPRDSESEAGVQSRDGESEAGVQPRDASAQPDVWIPPIIYGVFIEPVAEPKAAELPIPTVSDQASALPPGLPEKR